MLFYKSRAWHLFVWWTLLSLCGYSTSCLIAQVELLVSIGRLLYGSTALSPWLVLGPGMVFRLHCIWHQWDPLLYSSRALRLSYLAEVGLGALRRRLSWRMLH